MALFDFELVQFYNSDQSNSLCCLQCLKLLVNGAAYADGEYTISDLARPPYTRASSKNAGTIRKGIVVGCKRRMSVNAGVFGISEYEFSVYVNQVVALGLIERHKVDEVEYYYSTPKADSLTDNQVYKAVKELAGTVT